MTGIYDKFRGISKLVTRTQRFRILTDLIKSFNMM